MIGSRTRRERGPSGWCRAAPFAFAVGLAACAAPSAPLPAVPPTAPVTVDGRRLRALDAAMRAPAADSAAAGALRAAGLTPPFERRHLLSQGGRTIVAGFVPGGHPAHRDSLVVMTAAGAAGAVAVLEAASILAERSAFLAGPARSVLFAVAFDANRAPQAGGAAALSTVLSVPLWDPAGVVTAVVVGPGAASAGAAATERDIAFRAVEGDSPEGLALDAYRAALAAAGAPAPPVRTLTGGRPPADSL
jgi:hypothetical protein